MRLTFAEYLIMVAFLHIRVYIHIHIAVDSSNILKPTQDFREHIGISLCIQSDIMIIRDGKETLIFRTTDVSVSQTKYFEPVEAIKLNKNHLYVKIFVVLKFT